MYAFNVRTTVAGKTVVIEDEYNKENIINANHEAIAV